MPALALDLPSQFDVASIVDWAEKLMLLRNIEELSRTAIRSQFAAGDEPDNTVLDELLAEIRRRSQFAASSYPFGVTAEDVITLDRGVDRRVYELMMMLSLPDAHFREGTRMRDADQLFGLIVREAAGALYSGGRGLRFSCAGVD